MLKDFKAFVMKGNVLDLAVAVVMGGAFGAIVKSLVDDIIMPLVGGLIGGLDFGNLFVVLKAGEKAGPYLTLAAAKAAGASVLTYGAFLQAIVNFIIIAFSIFLFVRLISRFQKPAEVSTKECPYCMTEIPKAATRCSACTSQLEG